MQVFDVLILRWLNVIIPHIRNSREKQVLAAAAGMEAVGLDSRAVLVLAVAVEQLQALLAASSLSSGRCG
jgi:hypothetical protein